MSEFINSPFVRKICDVTQKSYDHGWDERNGGNISCRIDGEDIERYSDTRTFIRNIPIDFNANQLVGQYYLVTRSGCYFKNIVDEPDLNIGLVRIAKDGTSVDLFWGFSDGGQPTSEFPAHLMTHINRQKLSNEDRCVMHCHPTNLISMTFTVTLDEKKFTRILWKMQAESIVVFPDGVGIAPYMTPGTNEIGEVTASKMKKFKAVIWPHHGLFATGSTMDETFGLIETIEKAALIYTTIQIQGGEIIQTITDDDLLGLVDRFSIKPNVHFLTQSTN